MPPGVLELLLPYRDHKLLVLVIRHARKGERRGVSPPVATMQRLHPIPADLRRAARLQIHVPLEMRGRVAIDEFVGILRSLESTTASPSELPTGPSE
jgi:hypothetical protein